MNTPPLPPGPKSPAIWQLLQYTQSPLTFLEGCAREFGDPFTVRLAGYGTFVMMTDPDAVKDVFRGDAESLHSGEGNEFLSVTVGKNSVLVLDEEPHARQRRVLMPPLKGERMRAFFDSIQSATDGAICSWDVGQTLRMLEPMQDITLRVMLEVVLGLIAPNQIADFTSKMRSMLSFSRNRYTLILVKVTPFKQLQTMPWLPYFRHVREVDQLLFDHIQARREMPVYARGENVLTDLLAATHEDGQPLDDTEIRDAIMTLLLAGHDTTAIALAWALEQIAPRPDVVERIVDELQEVTGGGPPQADQLNQLEYLDAAIRESMRLRTIVPFVVRLTKKPFTAGGREYPPGVLLCPNSHLVHRRPDLYPEPEKFRPERFLERKYAAHEWFPFGGGNRMCLGMAFALYEMKAVLGTLFGMVHVSRPPRASSKSVRRGIVLAPHDGARMTVTKKPGRTTSQSIDPPDQVEEASHGGSEDQTEQD